ncbi:thioredoxin family protein [Caldilinea sp.]|uniref:thioredoxin family protein n=1 Tax=Caldilinea sp. TaxID=2293560 RepID=UPI001B0A7177|nr:thioredoxin family protein [Caldilinea sp.]MBO9392455.1 thioredoxin family protein [Caldilinea sp.]
MADATPVLPDDKLLAFEQCLTFQEYCELQEERNRLLTMRYAETRLTPAVQLALNAYEAPLNILAVVTDEDPDTIAVLPIIARMVDASPRMQLHILSESDDLMPLAALLPGVDVLNIVEEWVLPQFLVFDDEWELQAQWGPRPAQAEGNLNEWLSRYPEYEKLADDESPVAQRQYAALTTALTYEMRLWYNSSLATACQQEFCDVLLALLQSEENDEEQFV